MTNPSPQDTAAPSPSQGAPALDTSRDSQFRNSFMRQWRSESIKMSTLRSTWVMAVLAVALSGLVALAGGFGMRQYVQDADLQGSLEDLSIFLAVDVAISGYQLVMLVLAVFGCLVMTQEYSSGMIRATLVANPHRLSVLLAKAGQVAVVSVVLAVLATAAGMAAVLPFYEDVGLDLGLDNSTTWIVVAGLALFFISVAWLGLGLGALMRSTAGAIFAVVSVLLLAPIIFGVIPAEWANDIADYLPMMVSYQFLASNSWNGGDTGDLPVWGWMLVALAWGVVALIAGAIRIRRSDA